MNKGEKKIEQDAGRNLIAMLMVESDGEAALNKCAKDSPMYRAVENEIKLIQMMRHLTGE